ncbi:GNAT family N-acetyltransferase [Rhizobium sp. LC145]|uniref:GNAT family N-acetyltransferase n=1 Tax=Rhizobium sp. LC145 TaxID=1120688 RepID=UPI0009E332C4|nr:GNAT family N-acetyltransferase [Rhizobium sp. LC145]
MSERSAIPIGRARPADLDRMAEIELDAHEVWAAACGFTGEPSVMPREALKKALGEGLLFAAADEADRAVGFLAATEREGRLHIGEMSVETAWQKKGIGRRLMQTALEEGRRRGLPAATLTTDRLITFNAPFYASLGFRELPQAELPPDLKETLAAEIEAGLDPDRRIAMIARLAR